ncbi:MAG: hypothetical protein SH868_13310 [Bythopirellula sp.]|nr:hypothetical protein [Bythopirellula sp.]
MSPDDFSKQQYIALRAEISESKSRVFWLLITGMFLVLAAGYLAAAYPEAFANAAIPFLLLALMLSFIAEESNISRAGRYLREVVEPRIGALDGWEHWLESQGERYREVDRAFVVGFSTIFLTFFIISASLTIRQLDLAGRSQLLIWTAGTAYSLSAICVIYVLMRHWTASTKPSADEPPAGS